MKNYEELSYVIAHFLGVMHTYEEINGGIVRLVGYDLSWQIFVRPSDDVNDLIMSLPQEIIDDFLA